MHAYLLMVHKNQQQIINLLKLLDDSRNDIFIHCDIKSGLDLDALRSVVNKAGLYSVDRQNVVWGDYSQIECCFSLLRAACKNHYDYYHLISGQDLPLKSQEYIHSYFQNSHLNYIEVSNDAEFTRNHVLYRAGIYHFFTRTRPFSKRCDEVCCKLQQLVGVHRLRDASRFAYGSLWFSITDDFAQYLLTTEDKCRKTFRHGLCCDELFIQTAIINSPFKNTLYTKGGVSSNMRMIEWWPDNPDNPHIFTMADYDRLSSSDCLFARKFDSAVDGEIIRRISENVSEA